MLRVSSPLPSYLLGILPQQWGPPIDLGIFSFIFLISERPLEVSWIEGPCAGLFLPSGLCPGTWSRAILPSCPGGKGFHFPFFSSISQHWEPRKTWFRTNSEGRFVGETSDWPYKIVI